MKRNEFYHIGGQRRVLSKDGILTTHYDNGIIASRGEFIDGKREGEWRFFREDGPLLESGEFVHSHKEGLWITYDKDGEIASKVMYSKGIELV